MGVLYFRYKPYLFSLHLQVSVTKIFKTMLRKNSHRLDILAYCFSAVYYFNGLQCLFEVFSQWS